MKSAPSTTLKKEGIDGNLLQAQAMIGQNMHGFDMNKRTKKQRVLSPLGLLTYNPDTQSRGGTIDLIGENGLIISLHYQTGVVETIEINNGPSREGLLRKQQSPVTLGKRADVEGLMQVVTELARRVLDLERQLQELRAK